MKSIRDGVDGKDDEELEAGKAAATADAEKEPAKKDAEV
jgi:hypothetical protein